MLSEICHLIINHNFHITEERQKKPKKTLNDQIPVTEDQTCFKFYSMLKLGFMQQYQK